MIRRSVKFQLGAFLVISLLGIGYVGSNYVGFNFPWQDGPYTVKLYIPETGGIYPNAAVTERGVTVGRVGGVDLPEDSSVCGGEPTCVEVDLQIDPEHKIPDDVHATVAKLSAVGEQYVDLAPTRTGEPFLHDGSVISAEDATLPLDDNTLLVNVDKLINSVDQRHLRTVITELGKSFTDLGPSLQRLIDNGNALTQAAIDTLPEQLALIDDGKTVLDTQNDVAAQLKQWVASLADFSQQLKTSDPDLRNVLDRGIEASQAVAGLLRDNQSALPQLLGNLVLFNRIQSVRLPYVRATLELFPAQAAGGFYVTPGDGTAHFGMVLDNGSSCTTGYESTRVRGNNDDGNTPSDWGGPANLNAYCHGNGITNDYRGSRLVPRPDHAQISNSDPYPGPKYGKTNHPTVAEQERGSVPIASSAADPTVRVPYDPTTGLLTGLDGKPYQLGFNGPLDQVFGSSSWEWLLIAPTMR